MSRRFDGQLDRIEKEGIVAFVTNNSFLDGVAFDGMRKHLAGRLRRDLYFGLGWERSKGIEGFRCKCVRDSRRREYQPICKERSGTHRNHRVSSTIAPTICGTKNRNSVFWVNLNMLVVFSGKRFSLMNDTHGSPKDYITEFETSSFQWGIKKQKAARGDGVNAIFGLYSLAALRTNQS